MVETLFSQLQNNFSSVDFTHFSISDCNSSQSVRGVQHDERQPERSGQGEGSEEGQGEAEGCWRPRGQQGDDQGAEDGQVCLQ